jgi:hypothetical protein
MTQYPFETYSLLLTYDYSFIADIVCQASSVDHNFNNYYSIAKVIDLIICMLNGTAFATE